MMPFFNLTGLERVGVVGPEPGLLWIGLKALDCRAGDRIAAGLVCRLLDRRAKDGAAATLVDWLWMW